MLKKRIILVKIDCTGLGEEVQKSIQHILNNTRMSWWDKL